MEIFIFIIFSFIILGIFLYIEKQKEQRNKDKKRENELNSLAEKERIRKKVQKQKEDKKREVERRKLQKQKENKLREIERRKLQNLKEAERKEKQNKIDLSIRLEKTKLQKQKEEEAKKQEKIKLQKQKEKDAKQKEEEYLKIAQENSDNEKEINSIEFFREQCECENNTDYSNELKNLTNITFDTIRQISVRYIMNLPEEEKKILWEKLNHGVDILEDEKLLMQYIYSYGKMHKEKLKYVFNEFIKKKLDKQNIEIIDYGCGQALATMWLLDAFNKNKHDVKINNITLIEPSKIALERGILHIKSIQDIPVNPICEDLNKIINSDLKTNESIIKLHLFSNILDVNCIDIDKLAQKIIDTQKGINYFVCVSPCNKGADKVDKFFEIFKKKFAIDATNSWFYSNPHKTWIEWENWTIHARAFKIDFDYRQIVSFDLKNMGEEF